jgi:hypothetical protein
MAPSRKPLARVSRSGVRLFASLPRPSPGTLADRDGLCEVSVRWLHAAPPADLEPLTAVGMTNLSGSPL